MLAHHAVTFPKIYQRYVSLLNRDSQDTAFAHTIKHTSFGPKQIYHVEFYTYYTNELLVAFCGACLRFKHFLSQINDELLCSLVGNGHIYKYNRPSNIIYYLLRMGLYLLIAACISLPYSTYGIRYVGLYLLLHASPSLTVHMLTHFHTKCMQGRH